MLKRKVSCTFKRKITLEIQERIYPLRSFSKASAMLACSTLKVFTGTARMEAGDADVVEAGAFGFACRLATGASSSEKSNPPASSRVSGSLCLLSIADASYSVTVTPGQVQFALLVATVKPWVAQKLAL